MSVAALQPMRVRIIISMPWPKYQIVDVEVQYVVKSITALSIPLTAVNCLSFCSQTFTFSVCKFASQWCVTRAAANYYFH